MKKKIIKKTVGYFLLIIVIILWPLTRLESRIRNLLVRKNCKILEKLDNKILKKDEKWEEGDFIYYECYSTLYIKRCMKNLGFIKKIRGN